MNKAASRQIRGMPSRPGISTFGNTYRVVQPPSPSPQLAPPVPPQQSMLYLGATIHADGKFGCEVSRKIGAASAEFKALGPLWKSRSISKGRKWFFFFGSLIGTKLKYAVASALLLKADLRRLDGFHARCLRTLSFPESATKQ